ncbi:MAG: RNA polymerase sigma factor [Myxococcota bacterium]|nr:RNA polymerase sigma factor [Myxococcota bacterium]
MPSSEQLTEHVRAAQQGEAWAEAQVLNVALPLVLGWCASLGGPLVDHEDAAHDALETMLGRLHSLEAPEAFNSWLFGITRRTLAKHRRRAWVRRWVPGIDLDLTEDQGAGPQRQAELSELSSAVQEALEALPAAQREVLVLCDLEERADSEVAEMLDVPKGTVKSRLRLGRKRFRAELARLGATEALTPADGRRTT